MIRQGKDIFFTKEDKENITIHEYTNEEINRNLTRYKRRINRIKAPLILLLMILIIIGLFIPSFFFITSIGITLDCGFIILLEFLYKLNKGKASSKYYVELVLEEKENIEIVYENSATTGPETYKFYPVTGKDSITGYIFTCYVYKDQYFHSKCGETLKVSIHEELLQK